MSKDDDFIQPCKTNALDKCVTRHQYGICNWLEMLMEESHKLTVMNIK